MYKSGLFHDWVPKPVATFLIFFLLVILLLTNSVYSGNIGQMVSSTGIISEYFTWATFSATVGMGAAIPLIMRLKMRFRPKELMLASLVSMAFLSVVIATTNSAEVVVFSSMIYGFVKMYSMVELVLPSRPILSPNNENGPFYAKFYPIAIGVGQLGSPFLAKIALNTNWQMLHFYTAAILLATALLCIVVVHNQRIAPKMPLKNVDWWAIILFAASLMCFTYVVTFGKQQDWFTSKNIQYAAAASVITAVWLVVYQLNSKTPLIKFKIYSISNVRWGLFLLVGQGIFMGASSIQSIYTSAILGYNWIVNASLSLMMFPGIIIAGFVAFYWTKYKIPLKMYIFSAFASYVAYYIILYFMMMPGLNIEHFYLPQSLSGYGMGGLFISLWVYTLEKVPPQDMIFSVAPVMVFRSIITTAFFSGFFGWLQYRFQWQSVSNLAFYFDTVLMNNDASIGSFSQVQLGAVLAANKKLLGYVIITGFVFLILILFNTFGDKERYRLPKKNKKEQENSNEILSAEVGTVAGAL